MLMRLVIHTEIRVMMAQIFFFLSPKENYFEFRLECLIHVSCQNTLRQIRAV